jgi:3-methyladenine DNA glycosylase AlkD
MLDQLKKELQEKATPGKKEIYQRFFKTGKGEYGEGDVFIGLTMPDQREICKKYQEKLSLPKLKELLKSKIHEHRMCALIILVNKYKKSKSDEEKENIFNFYLENTKGINNWDLVDISCPNIVGEFLYRNKQHRNILYKLARSDNLWEKRISMVSMLYFTKYEDFEDVLALAEMHLSHPHDLMHKAVGWVLREVGKKDESLLKKFIKQHYDEMPRTTLRYSIERFPENERKKYLLGNI